MLTPLEVKKIDHGRDAIFQNFDLEESSNIVTLKIKLAEIIHNLGPYDIMGERVTSPPYFSGH